MDVTCNLTGARRHITYEVVILVAKCKTVLITKLSHARCWLRNQCILNIVDPVCNAVLPVKDFIAMIDGVIYHVRHCKASVLLFRG